MKIKEILELTETKAIGEIAKEYLIIDEKTTRLAMKEAGCFKWSHEETKWQQDEHENPINLEKSIYEFHKQLTQNEKRMKEVYGR